MGANDSLIAETYIPPIKAKIAPNSQGLIAHLDSKGRDD